MVISKQEIKNTFIGVLIGIGTWMIILPVREQIIALSPIQNQIVLGSIIIGVALYLRK